MMQVSFQVIISSLAENCNEQAAIQGDLYFILPDWF